uniref:RNA-dependent RNA polymerase n=1 Tax=Heterobasidion partitivirus 14 TaxID=1469907 RepID=W8NYT4_9VIRU|nr:RNA-dependent RNA polymerase [Heterobasidion partitivirus 14]
MFSFVPKFVNHISDWFFGPQPDPHGFVHNYKFLGYAKPNPFQRRNETLYSNYQTVVYKALRENLLGYDCEYIINGFHHPAATMDSVLDSMRKGDIPDHPIPMDDHFDRARLETFNRFKPPQLIRPVHFADLRKYNWNWHPNVEEPFYSDQELRTAVQQAHAAGILPDARMSFGNLKNVVFIRVRELLHYIKRNQLTNHRLLYPIMNLHVKPALTSVDDFKVRNIYGVTKIHVLPSAMFFWPLFRYYLDNRDDSPLLWGFETILGGMQMLNSMYLLSRLYYSTYVTVDWSGFDYRAYFSIINNVIQHDCRKFFDFHNGYIPTKFYHSSEADPEHLENLWNWIWTAINKMPVRLPDGTLYQRIHAGIASGLFTTQFLDSWYNALMILTVLDAMGFDISTVSLRVQGDDSIIALIFHIPSSEHIAFKEKFAALALYYFNHIARSEKNKVTNDTQGVEVLGYTNDNGYPRRDWRKLLAQLYHPRDNNPTFQRLKAKVCGFAYASMYADREVINVLKSIWDYLDSIGIKADLLPLQRDIILHSEENFEVPTDHFPTMEEVTQYLRVPKRRTAADSEAYFPMSHFMSHF